MRDALVNLNTGIGTSRSKLFGATYEDSPLLSASELEALFADNDLAYTIVSKIVEDALRGWFCAEREEDSEEDREASEEIKRELERLKARELLTHAATFGRLFGGAGVVLGVAGAGPLASPLDDEKVTRVEFLRPWDRQDMQANSWYPNGEVETYLFQPPPLSGSMQEQPMVVHESRLLTFHGAITTSRKRQQNQGWRLSVLQRVYAALLSFDQMFASADAMFSDASQAVFKLQGLIQSLAEADGSASQGNDVTTRLQLMDMLRSTAKAVVIDAGDETGAGAESFEVVDRATLPGLDGVIVQYYVRLCAAARMPLTVLLGMAPAGKDATGESDMSLWFNSVDVYRQTELTPPLLRLVRMIARTIGAAEDEDYEWCIKWPELQRPPPLDVATTAKMQVDSLAALITSQVLLPEEAALNLKRVMPEITIDLDARRKALVEATKELESREMTGPGKVEEPPEGVSPAPKETKRKTPAKARGRQA